MERWFLFQLEQLMIYNTEINRLITAFHNNDDFKIEDESDMFENGKPLTKAAVLIAITNQPNPTVILTQRPTWLRDHAGQVAFPGGKMDDSDTDTSHTALREAQEELSIEPSAVDIIGQCPEYCTGSGYRITPIIGIVPPDIEIKANADEVESWFETPTSFLFNRENLTKKSAIWNGQNRSYYDMQWQEYRIWGVTAGIIANIARRINDFQNGQ
jgi:8-oxo-dGTP pyrophosphatase MutT (NUDIX family)